MTRCASESQYPVRGLGWQAPNPVECRIETPRLVIRSYTLDDAQAMFETVRANREHLLPWMPWAKAGHEDVAGSAKYIAEQLFSARRGAEFPGIGVGIFERASGLFLGGTGCHDVRQETASAETGYWVRRDWCGKGIATEVLRHVLSWLLGARDTGGLGLTRVRVYCSSANAGSRRVPEKLGLRAEVMQRGDFFVEGHGATDRLGWGVMADEWDCARHAMGEGWGEEFAAR